MRLFSSKNAYTNTTLIHSLSMLIAIFFGISLSMDNKVLRSKHCNYASYKTICALSRHIPRAYHGILLRKLSNIIHVSKYILGISLAHLFI